MQIDLFASLLCISWHICAIYWNIFLWKFEVHFLAISSLLQDWSSWMEKDETIEKII